MSAPRGVPRDRLGPSRLARILAWGFSAHIAASAASAVPIPGLFATGVDDSGRPLPGGTVDPHWTLVRSADPAFSGPSAFVVNDGYPIPPWIAQSAVSKWIGPRANASPGNRPGDYRYRLAFDLTGLDPATASVTGRWSSDNAGTAILLNGVLTGFDYDGDFTTFSTEFTLRTGFVAGTNTLEFVVNNAGSSANPTGFRAELRGSAESLPPADAPPVLRGQPEDLVVAFKEQASFRVDAYGAVPLGFRWRFEGRDLDAANAPQLDLPWASPADAGRYDVVVSNAFGMVTSRVARLTLRASTASGSAREAPGPSSRRTGLTFTEAHAFPAPDPQGRDLRFVELYNTNPFPEDLSGWTLRGDLDFSFPEGTRLPGLGYLVVAPRPDHIRAAYGITNVTGGFDSRFGDGRRSIRLHKRSGAVVLRTDLPDGTPGAEAANGAGASRVLARPSLGEADPHAWTSSLFVGGSPGGPEPDLPLDAVEARFNEVLAEPESGRAPFVEIRNPGPLPADLSEAVLIRPDTGTSHVLPSATVVPAFGFLVIDDPALARALAPEGGRLFLLSADRRRVLDTVRYPARVPGTSSGWTPGSEPRWTATEFPTPGATNAWARRPDVVFSELHFQPIDDNDDAEFVELHNRTAAPLDLSGWALEGGIGFTFPAATRIEARGYVVVAKNPARWRDTLPIGDEATILGPFAGSLRNRGERIALVRPVTDTAARLGPSTASPATRYYAVEDETTYVPETRNRRWADGGGSTLERVDFDVPGDEPSAWQDSDESGKAPWTTVEATGSLTLTHPGVPSADQLQVLMLGPGEAILDDVEVLVAGSTRVANGRFDSGTNRWVFQGTHRTSRLEAGGGPDGSTALRIVASDRGDHVANRIRTTLTAPIPANTLATIRAKVRWIEGHPEILLRLRNGGLEAAARLAYPPNPGSPGSPNTRGFDNPPPIVSGVRHHPVLPAARQQVRVFARVLDRDGIDAVVLRYRADPSTTLAESAMSDDGRGPDEVPDDGVYTGLLPGQAAGTLVAFRVEAVDRRGGTNTFPQQAGADRRECLVRFGETLPSGAFGSYRIWMTTAARDAWTRREKMSNEDLSVTFVSGTDRVIYDAGAHYSGSSYTSPIYDSPVGALCGYDLSFPADDRFLGSDRATLDWPIRDDTDQRETLMFWFLEQFGLPNLYRRHVHLAVNGVRRGTIYDDVQQPDGDTVEEWYPDDPDGSLWKTDCWNEFDNTGSRIDPCILNTLERFPSSGPKKVARYRWNWRPRAVGSSANDFSDLFALVDAANATTQYVPTVEALVDVGHWMRTFAMNDLASYWDAFGNPNAKNTFLYKPRHGRWQLFCWDFDVGLGVFNDPPTAPLFDVGDPTISRMYRTPAFVRRYWAALQEALDGWFATGADSPVDRLLDAKYAAFRANNVALASPSGIKTWIRQRRTYLLQQLAGVRSDFAIGSNGGVDFSSTTDTITLTGRAPVSVDRILVQGRERTVTWTSISNWTVRVALAPGTNAVDVSGIDRFDRAVPGATDRIDVVYQGPPAPLASLRINEWQAENLTTRVNPVTGDTDDWFEIHNHGSTGVDLAGYSLTDRIQAPSRSLVPAGFQIPAGGFLLVWADERPDASVAGADLHADFRLNRDGETIALFDTLGRLVDAVTFDGQAADRSEGRWPDAATLPWFSFGTPTPGAPNAVPPSPPDFRLSVVGPGPDHALLVGWTAVVGRRYRVDGTEDLVAGRWQPAIEPFVANTVDTTVSLPTPPGPRRFYRVALVP